jgi:hypothetical protein
MTTAQVSTVRGHAYICDEGKSLKHLLYLAYSILDEYVMFLFIKL